jgi:hypothetical protein
MSSLQEAKDVITRIRRKWGVDDVETNALIERCLEMYLLFLTPNLFAFANTFFSFTEELYSKPTHFLCELIQNAEDNNFECNVPELNFNYTPGGLRVDCNETGFTEANVIALCHIGGSTKSGSNKSTGYIGEKGIGFKSVFRVASIVYVSSCNFSFRFDSSRRLGIIAPQWATFPQPTRPGYTSFYLQLSRGFEEQILINELLSLEPTVLAFLRKLRQINISITLPNATNITRKLEIHTEEVNNGLQLQKMRVSFTESQYITKRHRFGGLPKEKKRPGYSSSEILLAFPFEESTKSTYEVYAFLPIRNYGFPVSSFLSER